MIGKKKKTAELVDSNKLEGKTTTINDRADSCNEVWKLSLKAETDLKKKRNLMERRERLFITFQNRAIKIQNSLKTTYK